VTAAAANPEKIKVYTFSCLMGAWLEAAEEMDKVPLRYPEWTTDKGHAPRYYIFAPL